MDDQSLIREARRHIDDLLDLVTRGDYHRIKSHEMDAARSRVEAMFVQLQADLEERAAQLERAKEECDSWRDLAEQRATNWATAEAERDRAQTELDLVARAIPGVRYMDPPDGGSVTIAEQVARMCTEMLTATALAKDYARQALAAEAERDRAYELIAKQRDDIDARNMQVQAERARADRLAGAMALLQDGKRFAVTENVGHDWIPVEIHTLIGMKRCSICGTSWSGDGTPDVCPTPHLHKSTPRVWRCKVCGLSERVHRMSGHPSRNHKPQMELTDANRNEITTAAGNSNTVERLTAELAAERQRAEGLREALRIVIHRLDEGGPDAPGHSHYIAGIWDADNGDLAGKPCEWCAEWAKARAALEPRA